MTRPPDAGCAPIACTSLRQCALAVPQFRGSTTGAQEQSCAAKCPRSCLHGCKIEAVCRRVTTRRRRCLRAADLRFWLGSHSGTPRYPAPQPFQHRCKRNPLVRQSGRSERSRRHALVHPRSSVQDAVQAAARIPRATAIRRAGKHRREVHFAWTCYRQDVVASVPGN